MRKFGTKYWVRFSLDISSSEGAPEGLKMARWIATRMEKLFKEQIFDAGPHQRLFKIYKKGPRGGMTQVPFRKRSNG